MYTSFQRLIDDNNFVHLFKGGGGQGGKAHLQEFGDRVPNLSYFSNAGVSPAFIFSPRVGGFAPAICDCFENLRFSPKPRFKGSTLENPAKGTSFLWNPLFFGRDEYSAAHGNKCVAAYLHEYAPEASHFYRKQLRCNGKK